MAQLASSLVSMPKPHHIQEYTIFWGIWSRYYSHIGEKLFRGRSQLIKPLASVVPIDLPIAGCSTR